MSNPREIQWYAIGCVEHGGEFADVVIDENEDYLAIVPHKTMEVAVVFGPGGFEEAPLGYEEHLCKALDLHSQIFLQCRSTDRSYR